jgi:hypothetical protein
VVCLTSPSLDAAAPVPAPRLRCPRITLVTPGENFHGTLTLTNSYLLFFGRSMVYRSDSEQLRARKEVQLRQRLDEHRGASVPPSCSGPISADGANQVDQEGLKILPDICVRIPFHLAHALLPRRFLLRDSAFELFLRPTLTANHIKPGTISCLFTFSAFWGGRALADSRDSDIVLRNKFFQELSETISSLSLESKTGSSLNDGSERCVFSPSRTQVQKHRALRLKQREMSRDNEMK